LTPKEWRQAEPEGKVPLGKGKRAEAKMKTETIGTAGFSIRPVRRPPVKLNRIGVPDTGT
jgi:hypothetical protein